MKSEESTTPYCECGCGKKTTWNKRKKKWNKRLVGHHKWTEEMKNRASDFQKERGFFVKYNKTEKHSREATQSNQTRIVTEEMKRKISNSLLGRKQTNKSNIKRKIANIDGNLKLGKNNSYWNGGTSSYKHAGEWNKLKEEIKKRDNYTCQRCGSIKNIDTHHIDFTKDNHEPLNLISLCRSCHKNLHNKNLFCKFKIVQIKGINQIRILKKIKENIN